MVRRRAVEQPGIRQARICDLVLQQGNVTVEELSRRFDISSETARRDLGALANAGKLQKIHGGAKRILERGEGPFDDRMHRNALAKQLIAHKLSKIVQPGQTIFIDTGSTTLFAAGVLAQLNGLTVITNSSRIAAIFSDGKGKPKIFLLGGEYNGGNAQTVGTITIAEISSFKADHAILTVGALDEDCVMDYSSDEANVARAMIAASQKVTILADQSKFGQRATYQVCTYSQLDYLIVDKLPNDALHHKLKQSNVVVY